MLALVLIGFGCDRAPAAPEGEAAPAPAAPEIVPETVQQADALAGMVWIAGGAFTMGTDDPREMANERPARPVEVGGFWLDATPVTNAQFRAFVEDTGQLTKKRMETIDDETIEATIAFIKETVESGEPFFVWWNGTRMHFRTHLKEASVGLSAPRGDEYHDGMIEHDGHVGQLLDLLDELGIADNTIVMYSTDNGPHFNTWPDAGYTPFRKEKNSNWEGAYRVPAFARWPGKWPAGATLNGIVAHEDWMVTFATAAGKADLKEDLLDGYEAIGRQYKQHLDGYDMNEYFAKADTFETFDDNISASPRKEFYYVNDDAQVVAMRLGDWKGVFLENRADAFQIWREPFVELRIPLLFNLRRDPFEKAQIDANVYHDWFLDRPYVIVPMQQIAGKFFQTLKEYPPSQLPGSFNLEKIQKQIEAGASGG